MMTTFFNKFKKINFHFLLLLIILGLSSCKGPLEYLYKEIRNYGYIPYPTPLEYSGPGTMIGGDPSHLHIIASPETCFPYHIDGVPTSLRRVDRTSLPKRRYVIKASGNSKIELFNFLQTGTPTIQAGAKIDQVETVELEMQGVYIEYLDSISLTEFYRKSMSPTCKEYLDKVGFIIQAIKVDQLVFRFYSRKGGRINLSVNNINDMINIGTDTQWEIENNTQLIITTPKYIGHQLGSIRSGYEGMVLYRASKVLKNRYQFKPINIFKTTVKTTKIRHTEENKMHDLETEFRDFEDQNFIDLYSDYAEIQ